MSTIKVNSIEPANAGSEDYFLARAYANYDHSTNTLQNSANVSSVTDQALGLWQLSWTNSFSGTDYITSTCTSKDGSNTNGGNISVNENSYATTTSSQAYITQSYGNALQDRDGSCVTIFGDLA